MVALGKLSLCHVLCHSISPDGSRRFALQRNTLRMRDVCHMQIAQSVAYLCARAAKRTAMGYTKWNQVRCAIRYS